MGLNCFPMLSLLLILLAITVPSLQVDWQGTGNMNQTVISEVNTLINNNPISNSSKHTSIDIAAKAISDRLNFLWDPAWNVFIIRQGNQYDAVVYGYAFRNHWMWLNGLPVADIATKVWGYVIWKDYNCQNWATLNTDLGTGTSTLSNADWNSIMNPNAGIASNVLTDVWNYAYNFVKNAEAALPGRAYSIVVSSDASARRGGRLCLLNKNYLSLSAFYTPAGSNGYGSIFVFQTR